MDQEEIEQRSEAIMTAKPPFPSIYRGALFPAGEGAQPAIVPVPLDHGLGTYMFPEDLRTHEWVGTAAVAAGTAARVRPAWRMQAGASTVFLAFACAQKISAATGGMVNSGLSAASTQGAKARTVYGEVLFMKESLTRECIVDLDEADFNLVREKFVRWWAIHGTDPDKMLS